MQNALKNKIIELSGEGTLEQLDKFVKIAQENGYELVHIRNCSIDAKEISLLKQKYENIKLIVDTDHLHDVLCLAKSTTKGSVLTKDMIIVKKGKNGLTHDLLDFALGKKTLYDLNEGTILTFGLIEL